MSKQSSSVVPCVLCGSHSVIQAFFTAEETEERRELANSLPLWSPASSAVSFLNLTVGA
jgi:hypothetical protein